MLPRSGTYHSMHDIFEICRPAFRVESCSQSVRMQANNNLTGSIPALGLQQLTILMLGHNFLTGTIPQDWGSDILQILSLENNLLQGSLPAPRLVSLSAYAGGYTPDCLLLCHAELCCNSMHMEAFKRRRLNAHLMAGLLALQGARFVKQPVRAVSCQAGA